MKEILGVLENYHLIRSHRNHTLKALSCGFQHVQTRDHSVLRQRGRIDYQLIYIASGHGYFHIGGHDQDLSQGSMILFKPGDQQVYTYRKEDKTQAYWLHFVGTEIDEILPISNLESPLVTIPNETSEVLRLFKRIIREFQLRPLNYSDYANDCLHQLLLHTKRSLINYDTAQTLTHKNIEATIALMNEFYGKKNTLQYYAEYAGLSVSRFIYNFETFTGKAPMKYLTSIRMENAMQFLLNPDLSISEVGLIVGYEDPLYFSRVFKNYVGIPPSSYRKIHFKTL